MLLSSIPNLLGGQSTICSLGLMFWHLYAGSCCKSPRCFAETSKAHCSSYHPPTFNEKWAHKKTRRQVFEEFDFIGLVLFSGGLLVFLMGLSWGGSYYPWNSAHVIATIVVGFLTLVVFILYECFAPLKEPLVPMKLFLSIPWVADILVVAFGASVYFAFAIVWPTMVFSLYTSDLTRGGWYCCITGLGANTGQISGGLTARHFGKQKYQLIVVNALIVIFLGGIPVLSLSAFTFRLVALFLICH
jgi:hypothetical protein